MLSYIKPYLLEYFLSDKMLYKRRIKAEKIRIRMNKPRNMIVYLSISDPNSYLLIQVLPEFLARFKVQVTYKTIFHKQKAMFPEPDRWDANILNDSKRMAELYGLRGPVKGPSKQYLCEYISLLLASNEQDHDFLQKAKSIFDIYWTGSDSLINAYTKSYSIKDPSAQLARLTQNESDLLDSKHYLSGNIYYEGEWYWGLERLQYLERRLNTQGLSDENRVIYDKLHQHLISYDSKQIIKNAQEKTLTLYYSLRSPYSYLGLYRASQLAKHYGIKFEIKPVLPMMMRNLNVPKTKGTYIALDTKRESKLYGLPFGKLADPLGKGVERCYALFEYAKSQGKEERYLLNYARCVWSEGILSETDKGLKHIVKISGLDWQQAKPLLKDDSWREWVDSNLQELYDLELWGVPSFKYEGESVFGQDKLSFIEQAIRKDLLQS